jgi:hypothetical protein
VALIELFALLHDSRRRDEGGDRGHGERAAAVVASRTCVLISWRCSFMASILTAGMMMAAHIRPVPRERVGIIEHDLPGGARLRMDAFVNEKALRRVLQALTPHRRAARYTWLEAESSSWNRCPELMAAVIAGADLAGAAPGKGFSFCSGRPIKGAPKRAPDDGQPGAVEGISCTSRT